MAEELRELFDRALELTGEERRAFIAARTAGRPLLEAELARLIAHHEALGDFLARPVSADAVEPTPLPALPRHELLLVPGEVLGSYAVEGFLGGGGGGQVFRARQVSIGGRKVALKVVAAQRASAGDRERFLRGARMAAEVDHPSLAQVHDCGEERGLLYYSMRLVEGPTLQELLDERRRVPGCGSTDVRLIVQRVAEIAHALGTLHARRLIHQDVKPANILIEGGPAELRWHGRAVLVDFGLVKSLDSTSPASTVWATLPYAAPEVLLHRRADARSDVYALGLCLYDVLAGCAPEDRPSAGDGLEPLSRRCPAVDRDLEAIAQRAIELEPARRYVDGAELARDLAAWLEGRPVKARRLTRFELGRRWLRRHSADVLHWGTRGLALVGLVGSVFWLGQRARSWWSTANLVEASRTRGELAEVRHAASRIPPLVRGWLLSDATRATVDDLAKPGAAVARVVLEESRGGLERSLLLAARFVGHDGLGVHPELERYLQHPLRGESPVADPERMRAFDLVALLFHDHPVETPAQLASAAEFRRLFTLALREPPVHDPTQAGRVRRSCLTGLGACGGLDTLDEILAFHELAPRPDPEALRLGSQALCVLARRSHGCGFAQELLGRDWDDVLARLCRVLSPAEAVASPIQGMPEARDSLIEYVAFARRRQGLPPLAGHPCPNENGRDFRFHAANGEEGVFARLSDWSFLEELSPRERVVDAAAAFVYLDGAPQCERELAGFRELLRQKDPRYVGLFEESLTFLESSWRTWPYDLGSDPDTRVGRALDLPPLDQASSHVQEPPGDILRDEHSVAFWWFSPEQAHVAGNARSITLIEAPVLPDGERGFARLGIPGLSEARLHFHNSWSEPKRGLLLRLVYQQGVRGLLPYGGTATATLQELPDGVPLRFSATPSAVETQFPLSLRQLDPSGEFEVSIRLEPTSTTTLRLYSAEVFYR